MSAEARPVPGDAPLAATADPARLRHLAIRDFRNIPRADLAPPDEGVVLVGDNGQGKTNVLEAIYYCELLRSVRGARDVELVRWGAEGFHLDARAFVGEWQEIAVGFERTGRRKRVRVDGAPVDRLSEAIGRVPAVMFSPRDVALVAGAPSERRRYLDVMLALTSRRYLHALQAYRAALSRRNAALRDAGRGRADGEALAAVWEPALAEHGAVLWRERVAWVEREAPRFAELCAAIGERGAARMRYVSTLHPGEDVEGALAEAFAARRGLDLRRGVTHTGPQRDELELSLVPASGTARELRTYGSAGQQRTAAIALRMLEAATMRAATGAMPLVMLDDPFAELDARRTARILALLGSDGLGQTFLAVPRETDIPGELTRLARWRVRDGVVLGASGGGG